MEEILKTRTFRVSEEVSSKLKAVCADFENQNTALDALIKAYEVQKAKSVIIDRKTEISDLDTHLQAIQTAFLRSLELNENAEQRIRAEFQNMLQSKDEMIILLQEQNSELQTKAETAEMEYSTLKQATDARIEEMQGKVLESEKNAQNATERATEAFKAREQAEKISAMTAEQLELMKQQIIELKTKSEQSDSYKQQLEQATNNITALTAEIEKLKQQFVTQKEQYEIEKKIAVQTAVSETREKYQNKIEELQARQAEQLALFTKNGKK